MIMRIKSWPDISSQLKVLFLLLSAVFWVGCSTPAYIAQNDILIEQGRFDDAIENTKKYIVEDPGEPEHYYQLAQIYYLTNALDKAKQEIDKAIIIDPLRDRYRLLGGKISYKARDYFDAINHLLSCLVINNRLLEAHYLMALSYQQIGDPTKALAQLGSALSIEPLYFDAHLLSVSIQFDQIKKQMIASNVASDTAAYEAIHKSLNDLVLKLENALKIKPASLRGNILLSEIYYSMGAGYQAKRILEKWLEENGAENDVLLALSRIEYETDNLTIADKLLDRLKNPDLEARLFSYQIKKRLDPNLDLIPELKQLAQDHPDSETVYLMLGEFELNRGNLVKAEDHIQKSISLKPDYSHAYFQLSRILKAQNDLLGSRWALKKSFEYAPDNFRLQMLYLKGLIEDEQWELASKFISRFQPNSQNSDIVFYKAMLAKEKGDYSLAEHLFKSAQKKRYAPEIELQLAELEIEQGKYATAEKRLARLEALNPSNIDLVLVKSQLLYKTKRMAEIPPLLQPLLTKKNVKAKVHLLLAEIYVEQMNLQKAISILSEGLTRWPRHPELALAYTQYLGLEGRYDEAIQIIEEMQTYRHKYNELFYHRLRTYYYRAGEKEKFKAYPRNYKLKY